jgi:DNA-binding SARP family transcriptional activator
MRERIQVKLRAFGSLRVTIDNLRVTVASPKGRILLATLAMDAGKPTSHDKLCRALWNTNYSEKLDAAYRPHISRLRKALGSGRDLIVTEPAGYRLDMDSGDVDILTFDALYTAGKAAFDAGDWRRALGPLAQAEELWQGDPFADVASDYLRERHVSRLEGRLLIVQARRAEAAVRSSPPRAASDVLPEIRDLIRGNPANDHFRWLLMLTLYRAGQQALALKTYRDVWEYCREKLGREPDSALRKLNQRMIQSDLALLREPYSDRPET